MPRMNSIGGSKFQNYIDSLGIDNVINFFETKGVEVPQFLLTYEQPEIKGSMEEDEITGSRKGELIKGMAGDDIIEGGIGNDTIRAGIGNDTIYTFAWAGEPAMANPTVFDVGTRLDPFRPTKNNDTIYSGEGEDTLVFRWLLDAKVEILEKHRDEDGDVNYQAVAGENERDHDHWVESIGHITVMDFDVENDTLVLEGHTVNLQAINYEDVNGDGEMDTVAHFYSEQGANGAHDDDYLGSITFLSAVVEIDNDDIDRGVFYGVETPYDVA